MHPTPAPRAWPSQVRPQRGAAGPPRSEARLGGGARPRALLCAVGSLGRGRLPRRLRDGAAAAAAAADVACLLGRQRRRALRAQPLLRRQPAAPPHTPLHPQRAFRALGAPLSSLDCARVCWQAPRDSRRGCCAASSRRAACCAPSRAACAAARLPIAPASACGCWWRASRRCGCGGGSRRSAASPPRRCMHADTRGHARGGRRTGMLEHVRRAPPLTCTRRPRRADRAAHPPAEGVARPGGGGARHAHVAAGGRQLLLSRVPLRRVDGRLLPALPAPRALYGPPRPRAQGDDGRGRVHGHVHGHGHGHVHVHGHWHVRVLSCAWACACVRVGATR